MWSIPPVLIWINDDWNVAAISHLHNWCRTAQNYSSADIVWLVSNILRDNLWYISNFKQDNNEEIDLKKRKLKCWKHTSNDSKPYISRILMDLPVRLLPKASDLFICWISQSNRQAYIDFAKASLASTAYKIEKDELLPPQKKRKLKLIWLYILQNEWWSIL